MMRIMGLDVGEKRIGIAISDSMGWTAQGHSVLLRKNCEIDMADLKKLCLEFEIDKLVVGLPRNMNGSLGPKAEEVMAFGACLEEMLKIDVDYFDERLSTKAAERMLIDADVSRKKRKKVIDKLAAVNILQTYLDSQASKRSKE